MATQIVIVMILFLDNKAKVSNKSINYILQLIVSSGLVYYYAVMHESKDCK